MDKSKPDEKKKLVMVTQLFNRIFMDSENTMLEFGNEEPLYLPATHTTPAQLYSTKDYLSSALHEVAHWCIAGTARRQLQDFGYWYQTDGRNSEQQMAFEQVEVKPQALEAIFSVACGHKFSLSADNLNGPVGVSKEFRLAVCEQATKYLTNGLPRRAGLWVSNLQHEFHTQVEPDKVIKSIGEERTATAPSCNVLDGLVESLAC